MNRRNLIKQMALVGSCFALPSLAYAKEWRPSGPVKIIVPINGTTNDLIGRLVGSYIQKTWDIPVVVENKPGGGGTIGADFVARAKPDGQTLLVGYNGPMAIAPTLLKKNVKYDVFEDFKPITLAADVPEYLTVRKDLPVSTVADFLEYCKNNRVTYGSVATGSASHLTMAMFSKIAGIEPVHVPFKGGEAVMLALSGGRVDCSFLVPGNVLEYVKADKVKLIATTGHERFVDHPTIPTLKESGYPEMIATSWIGFFAPKGVDDRIIDAYYNVIAEGLKSDEVKERLLSIEFTMGGMPPSEFGKYVETDYEKWKKVIEESNIEL